MINKIHDEDEYVEPDYASGHCYGEGWGEGSGSVEGSCYPDGRVAFRIIEDGRTGHWKGDREYMRAMGGCDNGKGYG